MKNRIFKHADVAKILGVSRATVYNWQKEPFTEQEIKAKLDQMADDLDRALKTFGAISARMEAEEILERSRK